MGSMKRTQMRRCRPLEPGKPPARRTRLARSAGLQPVPWSRAVPPLTGGAVKSAATRRGSSSGKLTPPAPPEFTPKVKLLVRKRAGNGDEFQALCEACGRGLGRDGGEFQHRAARGAGGCRDRVINGPANCALMCSECHRKAESRDPGLGMDDAGFWLEHGATPEFDPRNVPVKLASEHGSGILAYLAADGLGPDGTGYLLAPPEAVAA